MDPRFTPRCRPLPGTRGLLAIIFTLAALAASGPAAAHPTAPTVAVDYRLRLSSATQNLAGVDVDVVDGERGLRLKADPSVGLVVKGALGEPLLRFSSTGVWVNRRSPTAAANKLVTSTRELSGSAWTRVSSGHTFVWHDHRLAPPPGLSIGSSAPFSVPIMLEGRPAALAGTFTRVARPRSWPWILGVLLVLGGLVVLGWGVPHRRAQAAVALAGIGAAGALVSNAAFATGDAVTRTGEWGNVAAAAVLGAAAAGVLLIRDRSARPWVAAILGLIVLTIGLGSLPVFWHGAVISSLPPTVVRLATAISVLAGAAAAVFGVLAGDDDSVDDLLQRVLERSSPSSSGRAT